MSLSLKGQSQKGFTLVELLIVVIILAILAAIVVPQFTSSTDDAKLATLDSNLGQIRSTIELYKAQHTSSGAFSGYPGDGPTNAGNASCTAKGSATVAGALALIESVTQYSDKNGNTCKDKDANYPFGPYSRSNFPNEPINNKGSAPADTAITSTGAKITAGTLGGWAYDTKSGQFVMNSTANDPKGVPYANH